MTNKELVDMVRWKYNHDYGLYQDHLAIPEEERTDWDKSFLEKWKTGSEFWGKILEDFQRKGFVGSTYRNYTWKIYAENDKLFFEVNKKRLPLKEIRNDFIFQLRKTRVNYYDLQSLILFFAEESYRDFWATLPDIFLFIEKNGKSEIQKGA